MITLEVCLELDLTLASSRNSFTCLIARAPSWRMLEDRTEIAKAQIKVVPNVTSKLPRDSCARFTRVNHLQLCNTG